MSFRTAYGNEWSENGWRMCNRDECALPISPGMTYIDTAPIRKGAPLTILSAFLKYYDDNVDPVSSSVWGWSAENDVDTSNHLSGTALDINAPKYPWGSRTMPADRVARVRKALEVFEGTVFWGADWDRADEMHFQMAYEEGDARNEAFAAKLRSGYLGIYGDDFRGGTPEGGANVDWLKNTIKNFKDKDMSWKDIFWFMDRNTSQARDQLLGPDGADGKFRGWAILGKSKVDPSRDNTVVEALAELRQDVKAIQDKLNGQK